MTNTNTELNSIVDLLGESQQDNNQPERELEEVEQIKTVETTVVEEPADEEVETQLESVQIDYDQIIPLVNGEKYTVGQLKDMVQSAKKQQADFIEKENVVLRKLEEVNRLTQYLDVVPQEVKQQAAAEMQQHIKQEFTRMLDVIPQWKDAVEFNKGKESIYALAREYNLESDISQVSDHRVIKLLFDFARIRDGIKATKELKPAKPTQTKAQSKPVPTQSEKQQQLIQKAKQTRNSQDELAAIATLFK